MSTQNGWRWCHKCQGFFFAGNPSQGVCPADHQAHDASQSGHYAAVVGDAPPLEGVSTTQNVPALLGENSAAGGRGVVGNSTSTSGTGVLGQAVGGDGVFGNTTSGRGVVGHSHSSAGVVGDSDTFDGVEGITRSNVAAGVSGHSDLSNGVLGFSKSGRGVFGNSETWQGVYGHSGSQAGVVGESDQFDGVFGISHDPSKAGVSGHNLDSQGKDNPNGLAGWFGGNVVVTGDVQLVNQDCAEDFDISCAEQIEPGTVMVIDQEGALRRSQQAYDRRVAGVVSGAGDCRPGIILGRQQSQDNKMPIALVGKVYCKVDADYSGIEVGDLLTTSPTPGHAMKAADPFKAFGSVIGKALKSLADGRGLIPVLVALQ
jgi:hypothetical protein